MNMHAKTSAGAESTCNPYYSSADAMTLHLSKKIALQLQVELQLDRFCWKWHSGPDKQLLKNDWNTKEKSAIFVMKKNIRRVERCMSGFHSGWWFFKNFLMKYETLLTMRKDEILESVVHGVRSIEPESQIILYGSRSRRDAGEDSDWDFLIVLEGDVDREREYVIQYRLDEIEWETGEVISAIIRSRSSWDDPRLLASPFRINVLREGITL